MVELSPKDASARLQLGDFYLLWHKKDKAEEAFKEAEKKDGKNIVVLAKLADFYLNEKKYDEAASYTDKILKINPQSHEGIFLKGRIHLSKNEFDAALNLFRNYIKDNPQSAQAMSMTSLHASCPIPVVLVVQMLRSPVIVNPVSYQMARVEQHIATDITLLSASPLLSPVKVFSSFPGSYIRRPSFVAAKTWEEVSLAARSRMSISAVPATSSSVA